MLGLSLKKLTIKGWWWWSSAELIGLAQAAVLVLGDEMGESLSHHKLWLCPFRCTLHVNRSALGVLFVCAL